MPIPHFKYSKSWKDENHGKKRPAGNARPALRRSGTGGVVPFVRSLRGKSVRDIIKTLLPYAFIGVGLALLVLLAMFAWYSRDLPRPDKIIDRSVAQSTKIYDRTGEHLLFEVHGAERRTIIPLEQIPEYLKWGTILVEDKNFYNHGGFDVKGIARAALKDVITFSAAEGGSTLTQQLVKNALLTNEKAISRKMKELVLAYQIERKFAKDQILQLYFNEIPYGSSSYGIESAAQLYFDISAKELSIAQAAALAALPRATTYYSPYGSNVDKLLARKNFIIGLLEEAEKISPQEAEAARSEELVFSERGNQLAAAEHFVIMVREKLAETYGEREVEQGGLKVITTLDWDMQQAAEAAIDEFAERNVEEYNATNAALVAIEPATGHILAMVGSADYYNAENQGNFNVALQGKRQPGSSFKPFVYAEGFERGYTDRTTLWDVVTKFGAGADGKEYEPHNYDLLERGPVSIRTALSGSLNVPAVKMLYLVGPRNVITRAREAGYTTFQDPDRYGLSLVLGGAEVTLLEHTNAYAAFAAEGLSRPHTSVLKVEDAEGKVLEEWKAPEEKRIYKTETMRLLSSVLSDNAARTPVFGANNYLTLGSRPVAAKTGTTNDYRDAWTMGYTPQLAAGVWVGNNDFSAMRRGADGSVVAAPIWNRFMRTALEKKETVAFTQPAIEYPEKRVLRGDLEGGTPIRIDRASGLLATERTPESFIEEKTFRTGHNILHYVDPKDPTGSEPSERGRDSMYPKWEEAVQRWMEKNEWKADEGEIPTEYDNVHVPENVPSITIVDPSDGATITTDISFFRVEASAPRGISRVEFYVDGELVAESRNAPYAGRYVPNPGIPNGFHTLRSRAFDDVDNSVSAEITFNLFVQKTNLSATWQKPTANASFKKSDFPVAIELRVPENLSKVEIFAAPKASPGQYTLIKNVSSPGTTVAASWSVAPAISGEYELYAMLWDQSGAAHRAAGMNVVIDVPNGDE